MDSPAVRMRAGCRQNAEKTEAEHMEEQKDKLGLETPEEDTRTDPHPAALLWMLVKGRRNDPEELEWE